MAHRLVRYAGVSVVATSTSLVILLLLVGLMGLPAAGSNIAATAIGTIPSFELNRRWVWSRRDRRSLLGQIVPFTVLSFAGLVVSTVAVAVISARTVHWTHWDRTVAVETANIAAFGSLWVVQFIVLDRILFRNRALHPAVRGEGHLRSGPPTFTADRQTAPRPTGAQHPMLINGAPSPAAANSRRE
jgi:putative flippase GtrA